MKTKRHESKDLNFEVNVRFRFKNYKAKFGLKYWVIAFTVALVRLAIKLWLAG